MLTKSKGGVAFIPTIVSFLCCIGVWLWSPAFLLLLPPVAPPGTQTKKPLSLKWGIQLLGPGVPVNDKYRLAFSDPSVANASTVLVMSDSRSPEESGYHGLSFRINAEYATLHNDTYLVFVHTPCLGNDIPSTESKVCVACVHKDQGARASPWCKLAALMAVMEAYPTAARFVYIDSDAFVNSKAPLPMEYFSSTLNMFYNYPFERSSPACSGIMFWNAGTDAKRILEEWWDTPGLNMEHDFEQSALRSPFWERNKASIQVIHEKTLVSEPGQTFQHIGHDRGDKRESIMQETLRTYLDEGRNLKAKSFIQSESKRMPESIYKFVEEPQLPKSRKLIYKSKYDPKGPLVGSTFCMQGTTVVDGKGFHSLKIDHVLSPSFGSQPEPPDPKHFLQKGTRERRNEARIPSVEHDRERNAQKPPIPSRDDNPATGSKKTSKDYVYCNAMEAINSPPGKRKEIELPYWEREDYGKVPAYLEKVKAEIEEEKKLVNKYVSDQFGNDIDLGQEIMDECERRELFNKLKRRWGEVNTEYQKYCHKAPDTQGDIRRKAAQEAELKQLEDDLEVLGRPGPLVVLTK